MKLSIGVVLFAAGTLGPSAAALDPPAPAGHVDVLFSPGGGCEARVVAELAKAKKTIRLQAFTFTSPVVVKALGDAKTRGVDCEVILDKSNRTDKYSAAPSVLDAGISCLIDDSHAVANNKIILIDDATILTGSFNFTKAAEASNAENLLVITDMPEVAKAYTDNYAKHRSHAKPYERPTGTAEPAPTGSADAGSTGTANPGAGGKVATTQPGSNGKVYVTPNGKRYHTAGCEFLHGAGRAIDRSEIKGKYTPCPKCKP